MKSFSSILIILSTLGAFIYASNNVKELTFFQGTYSATGHVVHYIPRIGQYFPQKFAEMHVDTDAKKAYLDQFFRQYWMFANDSYLIFPTVPGLCFKNTGYGIDTQNNNYKYAPPKASGTDVSFNTSKGPFKRYLGHVLDVGTCCDAATVEVLQFQDKVVEYNFAKYYPPFLELVNNTYVPYGTVTGSNIFNRFGVVNQTKFDLPSECNNPHTLFEYCLVIYGAFGWCNEAGNLAVPYHTHFPIPSEPEGRRHPKGVSETALPEQYKKHPN